MTNEWAPKLAYIGNSVLVNCWCSRCEDHWSELMDELDPDGWMCRMPHMILCPDCGNKRCPRATDHTLACTRSNASGQEGSRYT